MKRICFLILFVCITCISKGESDFPEVVKIESRRLYQELNLSLSISFPAFQEAMGRYYKNTVGDKDLLALIDFTKPSTEERFCVLDLGREKVLFVSHVSHGRKSGDNYAVSFSNEPGSYKSSLGLFRTGGTYYGKNGYSLLLEGLEKGVNDHARERAIVIHGADYADPAVLRNQQRLGRSLGCPALPPAISKEVIDTLKDGVLLYIYGQNRI